MLRKTRKVKNKTRKRLYLGGVNGTNANATPKPSFFNRISKSLKNRFKYLTFSKNAKNNAEFRLKEYNESRKQGMPTNATALTSSTKSNNNPGMPTNSTSSKSPFQLGPSQFGTNM